MVFKITIIYTTKHCVLQVLRQAYLICVVTICFSFEFSRVEILNLTCYLKYYVRGKRDKSEILNRRLSLICVDL